MTYPNLKYAVKSFTIPNPTKDSVRMIGDKAVFAIEFQIVHRKDFIGEKVRLWVNNLPIGYFEDVVPLGMTYETLAGMVDTLTDDCDTPHIHLNQSKEELMECRNNKLLKVAQLGENYDDFTVYYYGAEKYVGLIWYLNDHPFFIYPNYPTNIQYARIDKNLFKKIIHEYGQQLKHLSPTASQILQKI